MVAYLIFELRRLLRIRSMLLFGALLPMTLYVVFTGAAADDMSQRERGIPVAALVMVMMAGWGAVMGVLSFGSGVAYERAGGWLRQLRATPLPPSRVVAGKGLASTLTAVPPVVAIGAAAVVQHGVSLPPGRWLLIAAVMWLGTVPFALLGLAIGYALSRELAGPATTGAWLSLSIVGGLMVSPEVFPGWLQAVTWLTPTYRYAELGWRAVDGAPPTATGAAILAGWTLAFGLLAAWAYRRSSAAPGR
jgi:ABC-2 type transport system permease protein